MKKTTIAIALTSLMGAGAAQAIQIDGFTNGFTVESGAQASSNNNFTMLDGTGGSVGGAADVAMTWDGTVFTDANTDYNVNLGASASNMTLSSTTSFFGQIWTAHAVQVYAPGTYSFNTVESTTPLNMTVNSNQLGAHMLFDWGTSSNIDVAVVWDANGVFASAEFGGGTAPWNSVSIDDNLDGIPGISMVDGPFVDFNANFNLNSITPTTVPVPAAVWLFGSGLMGLVGVARRKKA